MTSKKKDKSTGLTPKQLHFARCVASGMTATSAYVEAYDVREGTSRKSITEQASRVRSDPNVSSRIDRLIRQREQAIAVSAVSDRERVLSKLRHWLDNAEQADSNKLRAAELLGKSVGLFKDVVETTDTRSSAELLDELDAILEQVDADDDHAGERHRDHDSPEQIH